MISRIIARTSCLLLLVVASAAAGQGLWIQGKAWLAQELLQQAWSDTLHTGEKQKPWPWADTWPVAKLSVPSLDTSLIVLEGLSGEAMAFGPARVRIRAAANQQGVTLIGGHRDTHLAFLQDLQAGDVFELEKADGSRQQFRWAYHWVADIEKDQLRISEQDNGLVLVTCYPFNAAQTGGPLRFVVVALPAEIDAGVNADDDQSKHSSNG